MTDPNLPDLVDQLAAHDIGYLTGGHADDGLTDVRCTAPPLTVEELVVALASSQNARLRDALAALLVRHPEYADKARNATREPIKPESTQLWIEASILAAASLQHEWSFLLNIYLPGWVPIAADDLAVVLGIAPPNLDYGRPCLSALGDLLRAHSVFPFNYEEGWEHSAQLLFSQLARGMNQYAA